MDINFASIQEKEVIDIKRGKKLGKIGDVVFDETETIIKAFVILGQPKVFGFKKTDDQIINIESVKSIGEDVILVDIEKQKNIKNDADLNKSNFIYTPKVFRKAKKQ